eukprot:363954-Chlamydomonas_euryale.AAC.9
MWHALTGVVGLSMDPSVDGAHVRMNEDCLPRQAWRDAINNLAPLEFEKRQQVGRITRSSVAAGVDNVVQPFLVCGLLLGSAANPGLGLLNGVLCSNRDLEAEDVEAIAFGKPV